MSCTFQIEIFILTLVVPARRPATITAAETPVAQYPVGAGDQIYAQVRKDKKPSSTATPTSQEAESIYEERSPPQVCVWDPASGIVLSWCE